MQIALAPSIIFLLLLLPNLVLAQSQLSAEYQPEELIADFHVLKGELQLLHSGLNRYTTKSQMDSVFQSIEEQLTESMNSIKFFRAIKPILKYIGNGHTDIIPSTAYHHALIHDLPRFPFIIDKVDEGLKILYNKSQNTDIKEGDIISSINGISANEIYQNLVMNTTRDGYNLSLPRIKVATNFSGYYAEHFGTPELFNIRILQNKEQKDIVIKACTRDEMLDNLNIQNKSAFYYAFQDNRAPLQAWTNEDVGYLVVKTFSEGILSNAEVNYKKEYKQFFKSLNKQKITRLVLDLRNNQGGHFAPQAELLKYLIKDPFIVTRKAYTSVDTLSNTAYYAKDENYHAFNRIKFTSAHDGVFNRKWKGLAVQESYKTGFSGQLFVLINEFTFSAAAELAGHLKDKTKAIFIGAETGGNPNVCTSGTTITIVLPNTKNILRIPTTSWVNNVDFSSNGRGIIPDITFKTNWADQEIRDKSITKELNQIIKNLR